MIISDNRILEKPPRGNRVIWRYLSLEKFLDVILNSQLFFTNLTKLTDQYEGTSFESDKRRLISKIKKGKNYKNEVREVIEKLQKSNDLRFYTLVNCWTLKRHESFALWKIYVGNGPGVAIRTTISNLKRSINETNQEFDEDISIAQVRYRETSEHPFSRVYSTITKKPFYDFEDELRLMILNFPLDHNGYDVPYNLNIGRTIKVNPKKLISEIYISPFISKEYRINVESAIVKIAPYLQGRFKISNIKDG
ncbi:MAG: hypothetical protein ACK52X_06145 [bacterium]|jgi:hypothetical protein